MKPVIIIGGGPAGATMGCYLSMAGIDNLIVERANHPRAHVGESLVNTTTRVFEEIGFLPTLENDGFFKKYGARWHAPNNGGSCGIKFKDVIPIKGVSQWHTYHVDRARMDMMLLKHAEKLGSKVYQGVPVRRVLFDDARRATGVEVEIGGRTVPLEASVVVDASGRNTLLGKQLKWLTKDAIFEQFCLHAWFEGINRGPAVSADDIHVFFLPVRRGWVWQIPITDTVTSMGLVVHRDAFDRDADRCFDEHAQLSSDVVNALRGARRINEWKQEGDYSYCMEHFCGDGFVLIGDASRFVDPIFASGVAVALTSAKFAAECIREAYRRNDFSAAVFRPYEERQRRGTAIWYEFIRLYYKALPLFTYFVQHPDYRCQLHELLQGEVYDRESAPVLKAMRDHIKAIEQSESHIFRKHLDESISLD